ncbi:MAG: hypothetical protein IJV85_00035 [Clostridia bacterium]|nr:hypothetical protein [Clostridia bacterium]
MKNVKKTLLKIRALQTEFLSAPPKRAAKITEKLVRLKATVFDGEPKDRL